MGDILGQKVKDALRTVQMAAPEVSESMIKAASALGVDSIKQSALRQVGSQLLMQRAKYQAALSVTCKGGAPIVQREATIKVLPIPAVSMALLESNMYFGSIIYMYCSANKQCSITSFGITPRLFIYKLLAMRINMAQLSNLNCDHWSSIFWTGGSFADSFCDLQSHGQGLKQDYRIQKCKICM